jgi:(heptosyl)LPS beta-1,4-glucosyltransferase
MTSLSAVVITKNEHENIDSCLQSLKWAVEIVVLDAGSTDDTCDIALRHGARVGKAEPWRGFGIQRQRAQSLARCEWIFMIDADERVSPELGDSIREFINKEPYIGRISRLNWCFGGFIRHSGWHPDLVDRLYPKELAHFSEALVHERLQNPRKLPVKLLRGSLLHFTYKDIQHYSLKSALYASLWAQDRQSNGEVASLSQAFAHALGCFVKMYLFGAGFLDGRRGLLLAVLSAQSAFNKYADLWLKSNPATVHSKD